MDKLHKRNRIIGFYGQFVVLKTLFSQTNISCGKQFAISLKIHFKSTINHCTFYNLIVELLFRFLRICKEKERLRLLNTYLHVINNHFTTTFGEQFN